MLENMLEGLSQQWPDFAFGASSFIADATTTHFKVKNRGAQIERNSKLRQEIQEKGTKHLLKKSIGINGALGAVVLGAACLGVDYLIGIEDSYLNLHHTFLYGACGLRHLTSIANVFYAKGMDKTAEIINIPTTLYLKTFFSKKYN